MNATPGRLEAFALMREELKRCREINAELLAALELLVAWIDEYHPEVAANIPRSRAAILKAKGE